MNEIDWSKAPEGATRYHPETSKTIEHWLKMVGDEEWIWTSSGKRWMPHLDVVVDGEYHDRPAPEWSGEGLPPVGTVCEHRGNGIGGVWQDVEIIAHWRAPAAQVAVYIPIEDGIHSGDTGRAIAETFRPIRTPEQIAAEEWEQQLREVEDVLSSIVSRDYRRQAAEALLDAGYRKVEGGAE